MVAVPAPARPRVLVSFKRASADGAAVPIVTGAPIVAIVCQLPRPVQRVPDWLQEVSIAVQRVGKADWKGAVRCDQVSSRVGHPGTQPRWGVNPLVVQPASDPPEGRYTNTQPNSGGQQNRACVTGQKEPGENAHGRHGARRGIEPKQTVLQSGRHERRLFLLHGAVVPPTVIPSRFAAVLLIAAKLTIAGRYQCP